MKIKGHDSEVTFAGLFYLDQKPASDCNFYFDWMKTTKSSAQKMFYLQIETHNQEFDRYY